MRLNTVFLNNIKMNKILHLIDKRRDIAIAGLSESRLSLFVGNLFKKVQQNILLLTDDNTRIDQIYQDLIRLINPEKILLFPEIEVLPHEQIITDLVEKRERLKLLQELTFNSGEARLVLTTASTMLRRLIPLNYFKGNSLEVNLEREFDLKQLAHDLAQIGYDRVGMVEEAGQFSIRGGILDIYTITDQKPWRIEFFGDQVDSIRQFDAVSQRSEDNLNKIIITPAREMLILPEKIKKVLPRIKRDFEQAITRLRELGNREEADYLCEKKAEAIENLEEFNYFPGVEQFLPYFFLEAATLLDYFNRKTLILFDHSDKIWQRLKGYHREIAETQASLLEQGSILPSCADNYLTPEQFTNKMKAYTNIFFTSYLKQTPLTKNCAEFSFESRGVAPFHGKLDLLVVRLQELLKEHFQIIITLNSASKAKRIANFLRDSKLPAIYSHGEFKREKIIVTAGSLAEGFIIDDLKMALYTEKEVIGKPQRKKRQIKDLEEGIKLSSLNELTIGDYVVHENHGIGKYLGVKTMVIQEKHQDYLVIKYAREDKLYVPTDQVNLVQKYIGADHNPPKLYKLGSNEWKKIKQKVKSSVKEMAIGLLELYANRETIEGFAFSEDTIWQKEFEEVFPYDETPDQLKAIEDVKRDMEDSKPMDRLLCGDVGYGKTEVAIRAAFKAAMDGKQTAVLVPTTILAQQHYNTFKDRMDNYPITVEMISRFKTPREQKEILRNLLIGKVDIIIGTHRLLSRDIIFKDLGMLVVDEEQRFGVSHKERLKELKRNVDVLTLTATPIPRTLHMALVGVRDMSVIETPPENRYPIRTYIREFNRLLIRDVIRKEMGRNGQVYFVHNRVEDIEDKADLINKLIPDCRVVVAHGQMNEHRLERLMMNFYNNEYDVLVCTTIIETGLDLPNVNTIIINRSNQMGLAQLYQLRGRVGRSNRIAYAYLFFERDRILPEIAEKRLRAIKEFTNLGSGFKIAMRDLEIRGAGNLLGAEQHGHIASIGFSLYCKLLENAVEELKGKKDDDSTEVEIKLAVDAYIPDNYIADFQQKIAIYKKIMGIKKMNYYIEVIDELIDRFGDPPEPVLNLIVISRLKLKAAKLGIGKIRQEKRLINCYLKNLDKLTGEKILRIIEKYPGKIKVRSGKEPIIGIRVSNVNELEKVLDDFLEII